MKTPESELFEIAENQQGYKFTTPLRTLIDVIEDGILADDLLLQAVQDAKKKGLVTKHAIETNQRCFPKVAENNGRNTWVKHLRRQ